MGSILPIARTLMHFHSNISLYFLAIIIRRGGGGTQPGFGYHCKRTLGAVAVNAV